MYLNTDSINEKLELMWSDRKRTIFGLPISLTTYKLNKEVLTIRKGLLSILEDDVRLYRILDVSLSQSFFQRLFSVGNLRICSSDKTLKDFTLKGVKNPQAVKEVLTKLVEKQRDEKRISGREFMSGFDVDDDNDDIV